MKKNITKNLISLFLLCLFSIVIGSGCQVDVSVKTGDWDSNGECTLPGNKCTIVTAGVEK